MNCNHCGAQIEKSNVKFCPHCGGEIEQKPETTAIDVSRSQPQNSGSAQSGNDYSNNGYSNNGYSGNGYDYDPNYGYYAGGNYGYGMNGTAAAPVERHQLPTTRAWWKMFLLGLITLGIYPLVVQDKMIHELNVAAFPHDGKITLSAGAAGVLGMITFMVYIFVYEHQYTARLKRELQYRGISYGIGPIYFWLLDVLFSWTLVCPIIFLHKICKAHNLINQDYNQKGV